MTPTLILQIIIGILILNYLVDVLLSFLNAKHFNDPLPEQLQDVYDADAYQKSQAYKAENFKFSMLTGAISFVAILFFFYVEGFAYIDSLARKLSTNDTVITLYFFGIIFIGADVLSTPLSYYKTFYIEEKYGFNKMTKKLFFLDKLKGLLLTVVIGGVLLTVIYQFYVLTESNFWWYTWILIAVFSLLMTLFYSTWIVPLFNKQTPLEPGGLRDKLGELAAKVDFQLDQIYVIDGSKRSTKANAYFTGFGKKKRIVLYDTLIKDLCVDEIVAVLAHEVGHYKKKHVLVNMLLSILLTGFTLFLLSIFINNELLANALSVKTPSFHIGLIAFSLLYSPISELTGLLMNILSRTFEYQADHFAKEYVGAAPLISGLKKLSRNSFSNLTPHPAYVFMHYSHPTLLQRIQAMS
ncbi:M48 family metallopeptidase [Flavobacteriaceae bacterium F08102]|nr:M48 family metallopeptidase [Flavobacteriaceae bacterium F08102]